MIKYANSDVTSETPFT